MNQYTPDRWHNSDGKAGTRAMLLKYSTPRVWYRRSVPLGATSAEQAYADERFITSAAVFPLGTDIQPAFDIVEWGIAVYFPGNDFVLVVVSSRDRLAWIDAVRGIGARAWYVCSGGEPYKWEMRQRIEEETKPDPVVLMPGHQKSGKKGIDHEAVACDIRAGFLTLTEIARKYSISKQMVGNIRRKYKIVI